LLIDRSSALIAEPCVGSELVPTIAALHHCFPNVTIRASA
jgi:hypothetical protein